MSSAMANAIVKERPVSSWSMPEDQLPRYLGSEATPEQCYKTILALIVEHAGADFVGVQTASPEHRLPAYVLFNHPRHHSTLALKLDENFGTEAILRCLAECDWRFKLPRRPG